MSSVRVWDLFVRLFHWSTAILFLSNYWLTEEGERTHRYIGYTLIGLVLARIIWGFIGTTYARFSSFVPTPTTLFGYLRAVRNGKHPYYLSHNPLGALMVLFLLVMLLATGSSGWLLTTDTFEAEPWLEELHELSANLVMFAVGVHIAAVIWVTHTARERLVPAMWDGMKPEKPEQAQDEKNR